MDFSDSKRPEIHIYHHHKHDDKACKRHKCRDFLLVRLLQDIVYYRGEYTDAGDFENNVDIHYNTITISATPPSAISLRISSPLFFYFFGFLYQFRGFGYTVQKQLLLRPVVGAF